jgi:tight adherence protein B
MDFFFHSIAGNILAAALFGFVVFAAATWAFRARSVRRIRTRLEPHVPALDVAVDGGTDARARLSFLNGLFGATERALGRLGFWRRFALMLERADAPLRPAEFFYVMVGSGLALAILFALVGAHVVLVLIGFVLGVVPPIVVLSVRAGRRQQAFDDQLPEVLMTMAGSLRAGHTFRQAMQAIVDEGEEPASKEFRRVLVELSIGRPVDDAFTAMAKRMNSSNFQYVISVVTVQREVGGSLAGLFEMVSETVRQRQQFAKRVRALTSTSRISAYILGFMPFFMAIVLTILKPGYLTPLFTESAGLFLVVVALSGIALGGLVLSRIVSFRMV